MTRKPNEEREPGSVSQQPPTTKRGARRAFDWLGFRGKTTWDWMSLLLGALAGAYVAVLTTFLTHTQTTELEAQRQMIEEQRRQDAAVETYADQMVTLFATKDYLDETQEDETRTLARARTLAAFENADLTHKKSLIRFLYDAQLIQGRVPPVSIDGANLTGVNLNDVDLREANLSGATLRNAVLGNTDLSGADLSYANLTDAEGVTNEELDQQARSLEGATMPNGQKYEDWLKSKGRGENTENSGP
jgi:uncharacterized protein YjbI with pentapeptide repeats